MKNVVKNIQTAGYNGARTLHIKADLVVLKARPCIYQTDLTIELTGHIHWYFLLLESFLLKTRKYC